MARRTARDGGERRRGGLAWEAPAPARRCGPLVARRLGERGVPVVLLHGLAASGRLWGAAFDRLGGGHRLLVPDLLGFGDSPWPPTGYTLRHHAAAVVGAMDAAGLGAGPAVVAAHSFGALVTLALAHHHPGRVGGMVLISPPLYRDPRSARAALRRALSWAERTFCTDTVHARRLCRAMCMRRPRLARWVATAYRPELPAAVARDGVRHTWESYSQSFAELVQARARPQWVLDAGVPVRLITGAADPLPEIELLRELAAAGGPRVRLEVLDGADHLVPLSHAELCITAVEEVAGGVGEYSSRPTPS